MPENDLDYELLRQITDQPTASQRGLAALLGVSVGKYNYCLRALVDKGWVKANNFRRSDDKTAYAYLFTTRGKPLPRSSLHIGNLFSLGGLKSEAQHPPRKVCTWIRRRSTASFSPRTG